MNGTTSNTHRKSSSKLMGSLWILLYLLLTFGPLILTMFVRADLPQRSFWREFSVALGFIGISLMALQFVITARIRQLKEPFGSDIVYLFHRQISIAAFLFIIVHPLLIFIESPGALRLLNIFTAPWRARMAVTSTIAMIIIVVTSLWRQKLRIEYDRWRITHGLLATIAVSAGFVHIFLAGVYTDVPVLRTVWMIYALVWIGLLAYTRVIKPWYEVLHPYRIVEVITELGDAWTIVLKPDGHRGMRFKPGQFTWLSVRDTPFKDKEHPFSFSSSAENTETLGLTIKNLGDFSSTVHALQPGEKAYLDGPHGALSCDRFPDRPGYVFIAGGVGVTPMMSMLRTLADRNDQRPLFFFYGNPDLESITFREELDTLRSRLNLTLVHVLERPPEGWQGEQGFITARILEKYLSEDRDSFQYFICGPEPMMNAVEQALDQINVPARRVRSERFSFV